MTTRPVPPVLPHIRVTWAETDTTDTFVRYNIYRRPGGETDWVRVAYVELRERLDYRDYNVASRVVYEYAVTVTTSVSGAEVENPKPTPVQGRVVFDWTYIHDISNAAEAYCAFYSLESDVASTQDVQFRKAWGRRAATAFVGELEAATLHLRGVPDIHRGPIWENMRTVQSKQRTEGALYCVRPGMSGELYFANIAALSKTSAEGTYTPTVDMVETHFDEAL